MSNKIAPSNDNNHDKALDDLAVKQTLGNKDTTTDDTTTQVVKSSTIDQSVNGDCVKSSAIKSSEVSAWTQANEHSQVLAQKCCENCGFVLDGPFCGRCGQSERSTIKFFGTVILHFLDDVFGFDSRAGRTILPLIFRPGFLTCEYFRGRRIHYVPPLRLYFFVSIVFFLMLELFTDDSVKELQQIQQATSQMSIAKISKQITKLENEMSAADYQPNDEDKRQLETLQAQKLQVIKDVSEQVAKLQVGMAELNPQQLPIEQLSADKQISIKAIQQVIDGLQNNLDERLVLDESQQSSGGELTHTEQQSGAGIEGQLVQSLNDDIQAAELASGNNKKGSFSLNLKPDFSWLTPEQNKQLEVFFADMEKKAKVAVEQDATPLVKQVLGVLPQMMFLLLPIFALILKLFYLFSKRFYMEHLTVALHSHAFIFVVLMILAIISSGYQYLPMSEQTALETAESIMVVLVFWMPIYLFLMQKKVYRQGVFMTLCKYCIVGITYMMLLGMATLIALFWGLAHT